MVGPPSRERQTGWGRSFSRVLRGRQPCFGLYATFSGLLQVALPASFVDFSGGVEASFGIGRTGARFALFLGRETVPTGDNKSQTDDRRNPKGFLIAHEFLLTGQ